ncbi:class I SAM-dependent methyltransferase [Amorphoplanes digitatis]|uniref:Trans-aconitate methyltransferase n=1 Tax=Actinoplanes digitatis TaxID=1868 RepID=A0A7W7HZP5_9ACTN|nr:class I SAM-dependent methyltransferase [Actinoplanes digitatis]MBB4763709.1 trans-aconitate methyltransferase [Actinoplanes digitatis]
MTHYLADVADAWQESWDRQQEAYLPDREHRIATMLDALRAGQVEHPPRVLDLAGGTGTIALRTLARFPDAEVTVVDQDPVLLALAGAALEGRAEIVSADLGDPAWTAALPHRRYDAVLTATALHWLAPERLTTLYAEIREVLRPGGLFANADHMPDEGLPGLTKRLIATADTRRETRYATGAALSWRDWWSRVAADPRLAPLHAERQKIYPAEHGSAEWTPPAAWHLGALRAAGFTETGLLWRGGTDATVAAVR